MATINERSLKKPFRTSLDWWNTTEDDKGNPPTRGLFIGNVPIGTKGSTIRKIFASFGNIETSSPAATGQVESGYALLTFENVDSAKEALSRLYLKDLFNQGEGCKIRFSNIDRRSKPPALETSCSKVVEARSEWFQQSKNAAPALAAAQKDEDGEIKSRGDLSPTKIAPTAPRKMLEHAKRVLTSPSAPRTTRVDISPPPLRRHDTYRPEPAPSREEKRLASHDLRPKDIDRYIPSYRTRDDKHRSPQGEEPDSPPRRRGRSPGWSSSYSQAFEARFSGSEDLESSSLGPFSTERPSDAAQVGDIPRQPDKVNIYGSSHLATARAVVTTSPLEKSAAARQVQEEGRTCNPVHTEELANPPHSNKIAKRAYSPEHTVTLPTTGKVSQSSPSLPSITAPQDEQAPSASTSPALNRLRVPTDDTSSVTSSSTKSSLRNKQCAHCRAPDGLLLGPLVKCKECNRRYHATCGKPCPNLTKEDEVFTCGRCRRKSKSSMSEQIRTASPELGTPNNDIMMPDASTNEHNRGSEDAETAAQLCMSNGRLLATSEAASKPDESKAVPEAHVDGIFGPPASMLPDVSNSGHEVVSPTTVPKPANSSQIHADPTEDAPVTCRIEASIARARGTTTMQRAERAPTYRKPYVTTEAEEDDGSMMGGLLPASAVTSAKVGSTALSNFEVQFPQPQQGPVNVRASGEPSRQDTSRPPPSESNPEEFSVLSMVPTRVQRKAIEMVRRYKNVTCPDWMSSGCKYKSNTCNFAHYDTGIDLPNAARYNPHWTCYRWMHKLPCAYGDHCLYSHVDTGLYVGRNGKYSTKHLTCSFWQNGGCVHSDERCLFAHQDTGYSASGRVARDVTNRAKMTSNRRSDAATVEHGPLADASSHGPHAALSAVRSVAYESGPPLIMASKPSNPLLALEAGFEGSRPSVDDGTLTAEQAAPQTPNRDLATPTDLTYNEALRFLGAKDDFVGDGQITALFRAKVKDEKALEPRAIKAIRFIAKHRKSALLQNWIDPGSARDQDSVDNASTSESSPYSPRSTLDDSKHLLRDELRVSPTQSMARGAQDLIYGVDTPFSPTFTTATSLQSSPLRDLGEGRSKILPAASSLPQATGSKLSTPFSPISASIGDAASAAAATTAPHQDQQAASQLCPRPQEPHASSSSKAQDDDSKVAAKAAHASSAPAKHYAKRSTVDPRTLRRNMLASAAAKSDSPAEGIVSNVASIKKCEKCEKRIFGAVSCCASCSKDSTSAQASPVQRLEGAGTFDADDSELLRPSAEVAEEGAQLLAKFMEHNAAQSVLDVARKHSTSSVPTAVPPKTLKRPHEEAMFIPRKRPKVVISLRKPAAARPEVQGSEASQTQHVSILDSKLNFSKPQSIDQVLYGEYEDKATKTASGHASGTTTDQRQNVEAPEPPDNNNKENRRPSYSSMPQAAEETGAKVGEEAASSEVIPTIGPSNNSMATKTNVSGISIQPATWAKDTFEDEDDVLSELSSSTDEPLPQQRIMLKLKVNKWTRCSECIRVHKSCLHNRVGDFDGARCADYLDKVQTGAKKWDSHWSRWRCDLTAAAERYTGARYEENSEPDDDSDGLEIWQDAAESMVPASPSSSEDPLGRISTNATPAIRRPPGRLDGAESNSSSNEKTKAKSLDVQPAIPTPAHTPSPALDVPEIASPQTPSKVATQPAAKSQKPDLKKLLGSLRKRGVQFDSDDGSDEDMDDITPSATAQPFSWPPKPSSLNLFDVAPALRPPADPAPHIPKSAPTSNNLRAGLSRKQLRKALPSLQCAERRAKYGNPHKIVDRDLPSQIVKTTIQEEAPLTEQQRLAFHVPTVETKEVRVLFEKFLGMPEEPVVVRDNMSRDREGKVVEFDLAYRDGRKSVGFTVGGRMVGDGKVRWPFARG